MKQLTLKVENRQKTGSGESGRLRKAGRVPAVRYGKSGVQQNFSIDAGELKMLLRETRGGGGVLIELKDEKDESHLSIFQAIERDSTSDLVTHIDFKEIIRGEDMTAVISVNITGDSIGVRNEDGVLEVGMHDIEIRCRPRHLVESITVDVSELHAGEHIYVRDLEAPEGITFTSREDLVVVTCLGKSASAKAEEEAEDAAAAAAAAEEAPAEAAPAS